MSKLTALELIEVAKIYMKDNAPRTAADRLRKAAERLDQIADEREAYLAAVHGGEQSEEITNA